MKKQCRRCLQEKNEKFFYQQQQKERGKVYKYRDSYCIECRGEYSQQKRRELKAQCVAYKGGQCTVCKLVDDPAVYDFHHIDPKKKDFSFGSTHRSFESLRAELDKCLLVCSNCHRKIHYASSKE